MAVVIFHYDLKTQTTKQTNRSVRLISSFLMPINSHCDAILLRVAGGLTEL